MGYTEEQVNEYCETAQKIGMAAAIKELGYPKSKSTAHYWLKNRGIVVEVDELRRRASETKQFYTEREQITVLNELLQRIMEKVQDSQLSPDDLSKLSRSAQMVVETLRLIGGQSTQNLEIQDSVDAEIRRLMKQFEEVEHAKASTQ